MSCPVWGAWLTQPYPQHPTAPVISAGRGPEREKNENSQNARTLRPQHPLLSKDSHTLLYPVQGSQVGIRAHQLHGATQGAGG